MFFLTLTWFGVYMDGHVTRQTLGIFSLSIGSCPAAASLVDLLTLPQCRLPGTAKAFRNKKKIKLVANHGMK